MRMINVLGNLAMLTLLCGLGVLFLDIGLYEIGAIGHQVASSVGDPVEGVTIGSFASVWLINLAR